MPYRHFLKFAGVWENYDECINTRGSVKSKLSAIGRKLFEGYATYRDLMQREGQADYYDRVQRLIDNPRLMRDIKQASDLGFLNDDDNMPQNERASPPPPPENKSFDDDDDEEMPTELLNVHSTARRRRPRDDEEEDDVAPKKSRSSKSSPMDNIFRRYLQRQSGEHKSELVREYERIASNSTSKSIDAASVAWKVLAGSLLSRQLLTSVDQLRAKGHAKYPLTAVESKVFKQKQWSNETQDDTEELDEADSKSLRWIPNNELLEVYLNPRLTVTAELHQGSAALTLSSTHATLFKISPELLTDAANHGGKVVPTRPSGGVDLVSSKGKDRLVRLQHSANLSYAFEAIKEAAEAPATDARKLFVVPKNSEPTVEQRALAATLRKVVDTTNKSQLLNAARVLKVSPLQLALKAAIDGSNRVVEALYRDPAISDEKLAMACRPVVSFLLNAVGHLPASLIDDDDDDGDASSSDDDDDDDQTGTSARVQTYHAMVVSRKRRASPLTAAQQEQVLKIVSEAQGRTSAVMAAHEKQLVSKKLPAGVDVGHIVSFRASEFGIPEYTALYQHLLGCGLSDDTATQLMLAVTNVAEQVYSKQKSVLGVDPDAVCDHLIARQFTAVTNSAAAIEETKALNSDRGVLESHGTNGPISFGAKTSVVGEIIANIKRERESMRKEREGFEGKDFSQLTSSVKPKSQAGRQKLPEGVKLSPSEQEQVHRLLSDYVLNRKEWKSYLSPSADTAHVIAAIQAYYTEYRSSIVNNDAERKKFQAEWGPETYTKLVSLSNQGWANRSFLPTTQQAQRAADSGQETTVSEAWAVMDQFLGAVSLDDNRLHDLLVQHNEEPLVGLLYFWPYIRVVGSHVVMVKDGEVGNVMYIEPDCLLSENGQQKLIFFHMSMYFKAIVMNGSALARAYFVYCQQVLGGYNHSPWDPLDDSHVQNVRQHGQHATSTGQGCTMFVVPTLMSREVKAAHMSVTGEFPHGLPIQPESKKTSNFEVAQVFRDWWGFDINNWVDSFNDAKRERMRSYSPETPTSNVIVSQTHQEYFDLNLKQWTGVIENRGHFGPDIYNGCLKAWNGKGKIQKGRVGSTQLKAP